MIGEKLGSFRVEAILGTGAMGVVYRAISETTGKTAAVKVISGELSQKAKTYERFRREAEILQQFRHPNIVRFLAVGRYKGTSYFAMEYVAGETLEQLIRRRGPLDWKEVVDLAIQTCEALHYAHEHGVVHRDLKPSNLMVSESGTIKLTDFGIAKDLDATALTATGRTLGTAAYMAPEQIRGTPEVSHKTDLYALGVVLYQLLTGRAPFEGASAVVLMHCHLNEPVPRPSAKVAEIPLSLDKLIVQLMSKNPNDRPWDAAAAMVALTEIRDKASQGATVPMVWPTASVEADSLIGGPSEPVKKPRKKKRTRRIALPELNRSFFEASLMVLALLVVGGIIGYMLWPPSAGYLYRHAERLMASKDPHEWRRAREEYLDALDRRFPNHPYRETTRAWRDRIELNVVEGRAEILESPMLARFSQPQTRAEHEYRAYFELANKAAKEGNELGAAGYWDELARKLKEHDAEERPWVLLARKRVADLKQKILQRREIVAGLLARAFQAERAGAPLEAAKIRDDLKEHYGKYTDLDDLFMASGLKPPSAQRASSTTGAAGSPPSKPEDTETPPAASPAEPPKS